MPRCILIRVVLFALLCYSSPARAVDFFWTGPGLGGPGGNFRTSQYWTYNPPPFPLVPAPGGADDTVNFDLGTPPEDRYTVTNVRGENDRLIVHDDSLTLVVPDVNIGSATDYVLSNDTATSPSLTVGVALGNVADVILAGGGGRAIVETQATTIGQAAFSTGILTVTDELRLIGSGDLIVGESGTGTLTIQNGAVVASDAGLLGLNEGLGFFGSGTATITGAGSTWNMDEGLTVGVEGAGTLLIEAGGNVDSLAGRIADSTAESSGAVTVRGAGSSWTNTGTLSVGNSGEGSMTVADGASVVSQTGFVGQAANSTGTATVTGTGSTWTTEFDLVVGRLGAGDLTIADGGSVANTIGYIGLFSGSMSTVTVTGAGSTWSSSDNLYVGDDGDGTLLISNGGSVENSAGHIGEQSGSTGRVTVNGAGSTWANSNAIIVGFAGDGELTIESGGSASSVSSVRIGFQSPSTGEVTVTGASSNLTTDLSVDVGQSGTGQLTISDGGSVSAAFSGSIGGNPGSTGTATVTGAGSTWTMADSLSVGFLGTGTLNVQNGGSVTSASGIIGRSGGATGTVNVSGLSTPGSTWEVTGQLSIAGYAPTGVAGGTGTLNISSGGTVDVSEDTVLFPNGLARLFDGTFGTSAINFEGGGQFQWSGGTLHVGIFEGDLTNPAGGTLAPGRSAGSTTILGDYTQSVGATLEIEIGGTATATQFDFVDVTGTAILGGELELDLINGFLPSATNEFIIFNANADLLSFFANVGNGQRLDTVDGLGSFLVHYGQTSAFNPNQIVLTDFIPDILPGDYNDNGTVDAPDYVVWRENEGTSSALHNDAIGGTIGPGHYDQWRAHFGQTSGSGAGASTDATAPEPTTLVLLMFAASGWCRRRSRTAFPVSKLINA